VLATQRLLERYAARPPRRFVYASSSSVYGDAERLPTREDDLPRPYSPYGVTKLAAEHLCLLYQRNHGVPAVALRFFTVYGPRQRPDMAFHRLLAAALDGRPFEVYGDGRQTRDFTYVGDVLAATLAAADRGRPGAVYNVASGRAVPLLEVLAIVAELADATPAVSFGRPLAGDAPHTAADIGRAAAELGYAPGTSLAEGLAAQWAWQREQPAAAAARGSA
jgi:UDP-glucuronate 4-epimerase